VNGAQQHRMGAGMIGAALLRSQHLPLTVRLAAAVVYGAAAGVLLHDQPYVAGAVMATVWVAAVLTAARPDAHGTATASDGQARQ
jgi:hypothetical protein